MDPYRRSARAHPSSHLGRWQIGKIEQHDSGALARREAKQSHFQLKADLRVPVRLLRNPVVRGPPVAEPPSSEQEGSSPYPPIYRHNSSFAIERLRERLRHSLIRDVLIARIEHQRPPQLPTLLPVHVFNSTGRWRRHASRLRHKV